MALTLRLVKGVPLEHTEGDDNLLGLANGVNWNTVVNAAATALTVASLALAAGNLTVSAGQVLASSGTKSAPGYSWKDRTDRGFFFHGGNSSIGLTDGANDVFDFNLISQIFQMGANVYLGWSPSYPDLVESDTRLYRDAANTLAQRNGANAQTFRLYSTFTDGANYERLTVKWQGSHVTYQTEAAGTGVVRDVAFYGAGIYFGNTTGAGTWFLSGDNLLTVTDNSRDIGASGANRPRTGYFGTQVNITNSGTYTPGNQLILSQAEPTRYYGIIGTKVAAGATRLWLGTISNFVDYSETLRLDNGQVLALDGSAAAPGIGFSSQPSVGLFTSGGGLLISVSGIQQVNVVNGAILLPAQVSIGGVTLLNDETHTLSQRNGTNAQALNIYNTFTDASNLRRFRVSYEAPYSVVSAAGIGTGAGAGLAIRTDTDILFQKQGAGTNWFIHTDGHWRAGPDNTVDLGASGANRPRTGYFGTTVVVGGATVPNTTISPEVVQINTPGGTAAAFRLLQNSIMDWYIRNPASSANLEFLEGGANPTFKLLPVGSSVNYGYVSGGATGNPVVFGAAGEATVAVIHRASGVGGFHRFDGGGVVFAEIRGMASAVNYLTIQATSTANPAQLSSVLSGDTNTGIDFIAKGAGAYNFYTRGDVASKLQFQIVDTASATNFIKVTGSNGGNPAISTSAGDIQSDRRIITTVAAGAVGHGFYAANTSTAGYANLRLGATGDTANGMALHQMGSTFGDSGDGSARRPSQTVFSAFETNGIAIAAEHGSGVIDFLTAGSATSNLRMRIDSAGNVQWRGATIMQNTQDAAYTLVAADANKHINHTSASAHTWTIPANSSVAYAIGTAITFRNGNGGGVVSIAITTDTMRLAGPGTTGTRSLAANGVATALKVASTEWIISGTGLT